MSIREVAILGFGAAGASVAWHLHERGPESFRLTIIDPRTAFPHDRTFCHFAGSSHAFTDCISHRWARQRIKTDESERSIAAPGEAYVAIPSDRFHARVLADLASSPRIQWRLGEGAELEAQHEEAVIVIDGKASKADLVIDARGGARGGEWCQHFGGYEIVIADDRFDPDEATLMAFSPSTEGVHFHYLLPFSARRALIQSTWFSKAPFARERYEQELKSWLRASYGIESFEPHRWESGVLPLCTQIDPPLPANNIVRIGTAMGALRASTGYAFIAIQREAEALTRSVLRGHRPRERHPYRLTTRLMDEAFLHRLRRNPMMAPALFARFFSARPEAVIRFLECRDRPAERLQILRALPALAMGRSLLSVLGKAVP